MRRIIELLSRILVLALGVGLLVGGIRDLDVQQRLRDGGVSVQGTVLTFEAGEIPRRRRTEVTYVFTTRDGQALRGSDFVRPWTRRQLREGGPIVVQYLASDPTTNQVLEDDEGGLYLLVIAAGVLAVLTGFAVVALSIAGRFAPRKAAVAKTEPATHPR
jgi:hypothetical protein